MHVLQKLKKNANKRQLTSIVVSFGTLLVIYCDNIAALRQSFSVCEQLGCLVRSVWLETLTCTMLKS